MKSLNEDLKNGQFRNVYLLYGEEAYLKKQYKDKLKTALVGDDTMNYAYFEGKGVNYKEVIDLAETMPFFAERRLLVLENTGFFKNATPELADYIKEMPDTTCLVFVESEVDKRGKLYKAVKDKGRISELSKQDENMLIRWVASLTQKEMRQMDDSTIRYFINKVGTDMENIRSELEKLICYTMERGQITAQDVDEICVTQITNHIFDMINAVAEKQQRKALDYYYDLLALKEPPMRILFLLARQFRLLLEVKELSEAGYANKDIAVKAGLHPFVAGKYKEQAKRFRKSQLRSIMEESVELEERVKTGQLSDTLAVELFIMKYTRRDENGSN